MIHLTTNDISFCFSGSGKMFITNENKKIKTLLLLSGLYVILVVSNWKNFLKSCRKRNETKKSDESQPKSNAQSSNFGFGQIKIFFH